MNDWKKEFDKWFNHGTKKEPRFAYASGVYPEVKAFIQDLLNRKVKKIEGLKKPIVVKYGQRVLNARAYNDALDQAISILKEKRDEQAKSNRSLGHDYCRLQARCKRFPG